VVSGSLPTGASSQFRWRLKVDVIPEYLVDTVQEVKLPEMTVRVQISKQAVIESAEFRSLKEDDEALKNFVLVKNNRLASFVKQID
jgi:hypothetical protein